MKRSFALREWLPFGGYQSQNALDISTTCQLRTETSQTYKQTPTPGFPLIDLENCH